MRPAYGPDLRNRHNGPDLVIGIHDRHQTGILPDRLLNLFRIDHAVFMNRKQFYLKALSAQSVQRM